MSGEFLNNNNVRVSLIPFEIVDNAPVCVAGNGTTVQMSGVQNGPQVCSHVLDSTVVI